MTENRTGLFAAIRFCQSYADIDFYFCIEMRVIDFMDTALGLLQERQAGIEIVQCEIYLPQPDLRQYPCHCVPAGLIRNIYALCPVLNRLPVLAAGIIASRDQLQQTCLI